MTQLHQKGSHPSHSRDTAESSSVGTSHVRPLPLKHTIWWSQTCPEKVPPHQTHPQKWGCPDSTPKSQKQGTSCRAPGQRQALRYQRRTIVKEESSTQAGSKEAEMGRSGNSGFPPRHSFVAIPGWEGILRRHIRGNLFDTKLSFLEAHLDSLQRDDC